MNFSANDLKSTKSKTNKKKQRGQIIIEYVLILFFVVMIATMLTDQLVRRNKEDPGIIIKIWTGLVNMISLDISSSSEVNP